MLSMDTGATEKDLFEIIRHQSEQIDQLIAENKALKAEIARLKKRIEELERRERKYAAPFSREKRTADPKSPGRRPGEGTFAHKAQPTPEQITATVARSAEGATEAGGVVRGAQSEAVDGQAVVGRAIAQASINVRGRPSR